MRARPFAVRLRQVRETFSAQVEAQKKVEESLLQKVTVLDNGLAAAELATGESKHLLQYEYARKLGNGAYGSVFELKKRDDANSIVALKHQLPPSLTELIKLEEEATLQSRCASSRFVVRCEASWRIGLHFCMLVEMCPGGELDKWIQSQGDRPLNLWRLITQCVEGLVHIHEAFIMHRDLKPEVSIPFPDTFPALNTHLFAKCRMYSLALEAC